MAIHPMNPIDAAWYHMDGPANLAMVTGVLLTKEPLDFEAVRAVYQQRLPEFDRFQQRVIESGLAQSTPHWQDMEPFDIDQHMHHIALPAAYDLAALKVLIADLASTPLNHEQPLWQVHVVDDVEGGSALIMRYHHCIGDAGAMMAVIRRLYDTQPQGTNAPEEQPSAKAAPIGILGTLAGITREAWTTLESVADVALHPQQILNKAAVVAGGAGMLVSELLKPADPPSPFKGEFGIRKQIAWSMPVAIADVKAVGAHHAAKLNDVLVAAMTGALRSYLKQRGVDVNHTTLRAMVPVDLRPPERVGQLGNAFGLVILDLAVAKAQSTARLALTKSRMDALKRSPEPIAMQLLFDIFGRGPKALEDLANRIFGSRASVVMTNVAGPRETVYLAGVPIEQMMFWVPHPGRELGMGISILSYRDSVTLSVISDAQLVPDPEAITDQFNREFKTLLHAVKVSRTKAAARRPTAKPVVRPKRAS